MQDQQKLRDPKPSIKKKDSADAARRKSPVAVLVQRVTRKYARAKAQASYFRQDGKRHPLPMGRDHSFVQNCNRTISSDLLVESNHSPPNDCYKSSQWEKKTVGERPAHTMLFYHHRNPKSGLGGASSTGGSGVNKEHAKQLREHMTAGRFADAMAMDFKDILNTSHPNRAFYALALYRCALYARQADFISTDADLKTVTALLDSVISPEDVREVDTEFAIAFESDAPLALPVAVKKVPKKS